MDTPRAFPVAGRTALVTGANRGIGEALVRALLARGARRVYAGARDPALLAPLLERADAQRIVPLRLDVTRPEDALAAARAAPDVDLLVNNAGVAHYGVRLVDAAAPDNLHEEMAVNVFGPLHLFRAFFDIVGHERGAIANILSGAALQHNPMLATYSCTKAAALSMTVGMRTLLRTRGTLVSAVIVGSVDTRLAQAVPGTVAKSSPDLVAANILDGVERGEEDIDADPGAVATRARVARDPKRAERHLDGRLPPLPPRAACAG